jgi:hypothetical protein
MFAAGFTEYANERQLMFSERRGLFTTVLLEGLNGNAAMSNGDVTTDRLIHYVRERLDDLTRDERVRQHLWHEEIGNRRSLVLATGVTPTLQPISVRLPAGTVRVVVRDDRHVQIAAQQIAPGSDTAKFDLEMTYYSLTAEPSGATATLTVLPGPPTVVDLRGPGQ